LIVFLPYFSRLICFYECSWFLFLPFMYIF
jgi:hypothetical protein